ncbi:DUF4304 domain-containing protein [Treponema zuelzerae]|uniref:DUF4304 domain-containing protein n=1 Tax=Teretinema zuelzerae TaxID=156 RepID=A0AAE3JJZ5_9SPIR|nr:DUF4304 domain-containing protein [Teretinema zuelzerae]MCD1656038.1 DUF4304 domain-containing protein [Teretinema zuelzerae]
MDQCIKSIESLLIANNYKKHKRFFYKEGCDFTVVLDIQKSSSSNNENVKMTINFGLIIKNIDGIIPTDINVIVKADQCNGKSRIGHLLGKNDWWFLCKRDQDIKNEKYIYNEILQFLLICESIIETKEIYKEKIRKQIFIVKPEYRDLFIKEMIKIETNNIQINS